MFQRARLNLTIWYLIIIMTISLLFTMVIYLRVNSDLIRFEQTQIQLQKDIKEGKMGAYFKPEVNPSVIILEPEDIHDARNALIIILGIINLTILVISGVAGYFLAGKTLKPIKEMVDEQKRFISDSSHELRTPLTSLRSEIEITLRNKKLTLPQAKSILESNLEEVINLQTLSDNLLELAEKGKPNQLQLEPISLLSILNEAISKTEASANKKQIEIINQTKEFEINGSKDRLREVFVILIDNAIKYSNNNTKIEVVNKKVKDKIHIAVIDYGIGISNHDLPHIFDRFYRSDTSRTERGYGLGLSIAQQIIYEHNGSISVKSTPRKGSKFTVKLPAS